METFIKRNHEQKQLGLGILILAVGAVFLLRNSGINLPNWILNWHTIMLGAGLWLGYRKNFQGSGWLALTIIGAIFTLKEMIVFDFEISQIQIPFVLIGLGIYLIIKPKKNIFFARSKQDQTVKFTEIKN